MRKLTFHVFVLVLLSITYVSASHAETRWIIDPASNVGGITPESSKAHIAELFGAENVERYEIPVGEGETVEGTRVYGGTDNEFLIEWNEESNTPERITIENPKTQWKTKEGITIGTTLDELEKINSAPFLLTGFAWGYEGRSVSWENGTLPPELQVDFEHKVLPQHEERQVEGDGFYPSNNPIIKKKALKVRALYIRWDRGE